VDFHGGAVDHTGIDPGGELVDIGSNRLFGVVFWPEIGDRLFSGACLIVIIIASWDWNGHLLGVSLIAERDIVVEELPPRAEQHRQVELVRYHDISLQLWNRFAEESGIGQVLNRFALAVFVASWSSSGYVGIGFSPIGMFEVVAAAVDTAHDVLQFQESRDIDLSWLFGVLFYENGLS